MGEFERQQELASLVVKVSSRVEEAHRRIDELQRLIEAQNKTLTMISDTISRAITRFEEQHKAHFETKKRLYQTALTEFASHLKNLDTRVDELEFFRDGFNGTIKTILFVSAILAAIGAFFKINIK